MSFMWCPDSGTGKTEDNYGFTQRRDILNDGSEQGNFCGIIPLTHMFGFCENYDKVMYSIRHQLILRRASTNANAILKSDAKNGGDDKVPDEEIVLTKISWRIPHLKPSDDYLVKLSHDIQSRVKLDINYLNRQCERIEMDNGHTQLDWRLNITAGAEKPKYIILGFQTDKEDKQTGNSTTFNHCSLNNANVFLNSERYPEMNLQLDFYRNIYTTAYKMLCDYMDTLAGDKRCAITMGEYRYLYPLFVFDVSRQSEKLKNAATDIRIRASFKKTSLIKR
ncbi:uncharacterized protein LOC143026115 [Oratosquilla oratoria]|uniref:uncharacterized protein LOC143026115 n=1 Tax=Oratosquilla oratoria TaxID=337810 RepID=UPI003F774D50